MVSAALLNPRSADYRAMQAFVHKEPSEYQLESINYTYNAQLTLRQRVACLAAAFFAGLFTLGLGATPVFRKMVEHFVQKGKAQDDGQFYNSNTLEAARQAAWKAFPAVRTTTSELV